jgi:hypothetical protein
MHSPHEVYRNELKEKYKLFGWALWEPNPDPDTRIMSGDVGFISDGRFVRIFNVRLKSDHPLQRHGVPEGFYTLNPPPFQKSWLDGGDYHSNSVRMTQEDG